MTDLGAFAYMLGKALAKAGREYSSELRKADFGVAAPVVPEPDAAVEPISATKEAKPKASKKRDRSDDKGDGPGQGSTDCIGNWVDGVACPVTDPAQREMRDGMVIAKSNEAGKPGKRVRSCKPCWKATEKSKSAKKAASGEAPAKRQRAPKQQLKIKLPNPPRHVVPAVATTGDDDEDEDDNEDEEEAPALDIEVEDE